jgi:hypothetical protein
MVYMFLVVPYFQKSLMIRSLVPRSFMYRELEYEPSTSVTSGISTVLYEVVSLVPKRYFFFGVYYTYLPYLLLSETIAVTSAMVKTKWIFISYNFSLHHLLMPWKSVSILQSQIISEHHIIF